MTAIATITVANDAAVAQTFTPVGITNGVVKWVSNDSIFDAKRVLTLSEALPARGSSVIRLKAKVTLPIMSTVDTTLKVAEAVANIELVFPKQATDTQRKDLRAYAQNFLGKDEIKNFVNTLEGVV